MYSDILVPTSTPSDVERVLDHVNEVSADGATIHVLHVLTTPPDESTPATGGCVPTHEFGEEVIEESAEVVEQAGYDVSPEVTTGSAHKAITQYADEIDADAIVMTTHGRTGLKRLLFGSVTESVVRNADIPVITIPSSED